MKPEPATETCADGCCAPSVAAPDRLRARFGDRSRFGGRGRVAVFGCRPGSPRTAGAEGDRDFLFPLAISVTGEAVSTFFTGAAAESSRTGIVLAAISLAVMPVLSAAQRR